MTIIILLSMAGLLAVLFMLVLATKAGRSDGRSDGGDASPVLIDSGDHGGGDAGADGGGGGD